MSWNLKIIKYQKGILTKTFQILLRNFYKRYLDLLSFQDKQISRTKNSEIISKKHKHVCMEITKVFVLSKNIRI
jgi:hypothetical protein